jgi:hypothetical protein
VGAFGLCLNQEERKRKKEDTKMLKYNAGSRVGKGTYWNFANGERIDVSDESVLPGGKRTVYFRLPATGIIVLGPIMGLLYAAFLPFIGIAMLVKVVIQKVASLAFSSAKSSASFGWRPSESYLAGQKKKEGSSERESDEKRRDKE